MSRLHIFADEAGDFDFSRKDRASKYFILCTVAMDTCEVGNALSLLRRELAWQGAPLGDYFHATSDKQIIRDAVFETICRHPFRVHATVMEKSKAQPQVMISRPSFYKYGWFYHFKFGTTRAIRAKPELLVTAATLGTRKERIAFTAAVSDVMSQTVRSKWAANFCPAAADPCLQVADYCAWAIQRKWERGDTKSYNLIHARIVYEYDLWARGDKHYY